MQARLRGCKDMKKKTDIIKITYSWEKYDSKKDCKKSVVYRWSNKKNKINIGESGNLHKRLSNYKNVSAKSGGTNRRWLKENGNNTKGLKIIHPEKVEISSPNENRPHALLIPQDQGKTINYFKSIEEADRCNIKTAEEALNLTKNKIVDALEHQHIKAIRTGKKWTLSLSSLNAFKTKYYAENKKANKFTIVDAKVIADNLSICVRSAQQLMQSDLKQYTITLCNKSYTETAALSKLLLDKNMQG